MIYRVFVVFFDELVIVVIWTERLKLLFLSLFEQYHMI